MKKLSLLFAAIILMALTANAQGRREYSFINSWYGWSKLESWDYTMNYEYKLNTKTEKAKIAKAGIKELTQTITKRKKTYIWTKLSFDTKGNCISLMVNRKNGKLKQQFFFTYSPENRCISKTMLNGKGKEIRKMTYQYNSDTLVTESVLYKKGKEIRKNTSSYNKYREYTEQTFYKKGKIKAKTTSKYDSIRILESYYYKNGSPDFKWKWTYTYYDNKSRKSSVMYKADGTVKYTWNYDCKTDGELKSKHADSTLICQNLEYDADSNRTYTWREFNEKGKPRKMVSVYTKKRVLLQYASYHDNDIPSYFFKYNKVTSEIEQQIYYNNKGVERWKTLHTFDSSNNVIESNYYQKGKLSTKTVKEYDSKNFVTKSTDYDKKNKIVSSNKFDYLFF